MVDVSAVEVHGGFASALTKADDIFDRLMGSDVEPRKRFIQTHAKSVRNLDI